MDKVHTALGNLEVDEMLLTQMRQVARGNGPSTFEGNLWLNMLNTRHTAPGTSLALPLLHGPVTAATIGSLTYTRVPKPFRPQHSLGKLQEYWDTKLNGQQDPKPRHTRDLRPL